MATATITSSRYRPPPEPVQVTERVFWQARLADHGIQGATPNVIATAMIVNRDQTHFSSNHSLVDSAAATLTIQHKVVLLKHSNEIVNLPSFHCPKNTLKYATTRPDDTANDSGCHQGPPVGIRDNLGPWDRYKTKSAVSKIFAL